MNNKKTDQILANIKNLLLAKIKRSCKKLFNTLGETLHKP